MIRVRLAFAAAMLAVAALLAPGLAGAYPWPVKPFHEQHPIRGFFGDPRTVYESGVLAGGFTGPGFFSFHQGVDIAAPDGTPIYAIADGTTHYLGAATLNLVTNHEVTFQYFHIVPIVGEDQHVVTSRTLLGYVQAPYNHVHITEIDGTHVVNPLQRGHLTPYRDATKPTIHDVVVRDVRGELQTPLGLCGRIELDADAFDTPPLAVAGKFRGLPVSPALVRWTIRRLDGPTVVPWRTAADFRTILPPNSKFWDVYAKGTYQNDPRFGHEQYPSMPGRYLFQLAANYDTTSVANGVYVVTVRASDVRGNTAVVSRRIAILNARKSVCPSSLAAPSGGAADGEPPGIGG